MANDAEQTKAAIARARAMINALCKSPSEPGRRDLTMSIPANHDRDPDLVIGAALDAAEARIADLEGRLRGALNIGERITDLVPTQAEARCLLKSADLYRAARMAVGKPVDILDGAVAKLQVVAGDSIPVRPVDNG